MLTVGDSVRVLYSECKGFGAAKVGHCGVVTRVEPLHDLVGVYRVQFPDGAWEYLDREVEKTASVIFSTSTILAEEAPPASRARATLRAYTLLRKVAQLSRV